MKELETTIADLYVKLDQEPTNPVHYDNLGSALLKSRREQESILVYRRGIHHCKNGDQEKLGLLYNNLAISLMAVERYEDALEQLSLALAKTTDEDEKKLMMLTLFTIAQQLDDYGDILQEIEKRDPSDSIVRATKEWIYCNQGNSLIDKGDFEGGIAYLRKSLEFGEAKSTYVLLASALLKKNAYEEAASSIFNSIELGLDVELITGFAITFNGANQSSLAVGFLEKAQKYHPNSEPLKYALAITKQKVD